MRSPTDPSQSNDPTPPELKRPASVGPGVLQRTPSVTSIKPSTRNSLIPSQNASSESLPEKRGTSKGRGRVLKVLGDLSLICGILPDALASYTQSVEILRLTTDYVWHASALEGVGMVLVLLAYLKVEFVVSSSSIENFLHGIGSDNCAANDNSLQLRTKQIHSPPNQRFFYRSIPYAIITRRLARNPHPYPQLVSSFIILFDIGARSANLYLRKHCTAS